jgi:nucleotide-binding universal stress UspA family protein
MKIEHILIVSDLSAESMRPLEPVAVLARDSGSKLTLLHVVQDLKMVAPGAPLAPPLSSPDLDKDIEHARVALEEQRDALGTGLNVKIDVIAANKVPKAIVEYAHANDASLIAISTHGRTGFRHLALGSVAESVIRTSDIPVLSFHRTKDKHS